MYHSLLKEEKTLKGDMLYKVWGWDSDLGWLAPNCSLLPCPVGRKQEDREQG